MWPHTFRRPKRRARWARASGRTKRGGRPGGWEASETHPQALDVITGGAGAIPALLGLARRLDRPSLTDTAIRHGEFLLEQARRGEHAPGLSWPCGVPGIGHFYLRL
ncbi:MAG TPA: hypothetical protein VFJ16_27265 [Longimicrobium sp.]|nr:hypothetical protein [Longimicrobium sp.]